MRCYCRYAVLALFLTNSVLACDLSGKSLTTLIRICLSTGCQQSQLRLVIAGDRIFAHDENPETGRIYRIGKTVDATADPEQNRTSTLTRPPDVTYYRVLLNATKADTQLILQEEETFVYPNSPNKNVITTTTRYNLGNCTYCSGDYTFDARLSSGERETQRVSLEQCSIQSAR